uniref:Uncharacterized protein n=1 Tax=Glossina morsitans morsitans TaxID=37546 RepID=A0A1B0GCC2_GLOMM
MYVMHVAKPMDWHRMGLNNITATPPTPSPPQSTSTSTPTPTIETQPTGELSQSNKIGDDDGGDGACGSLRHSLSV